MFALSACGDDTSPLDATSSADAVVAVQDAGADDVQDAPADAATPDATESTDAFVMADAFVLTDVGAPDAASDSGPDEGPETLGRRFNDVEGALRDQQCECGVASGEFPTLEACVAEVPTTYEGEEQIECVQALLDANLEEREIFNCQVDAYEALLPCVAPLSCEELEGPEAQGCTSEIQELLRECDRSDGTIMDGIQECAR